MTAFPAFALQSAIVTALKANSALSAFVSARIYDVVPVHAALPYLTYGPLTLRDWSASSFDGCEHLISLNLYSNSPGFREAYAITDAVVACLHQAELTLGEHALVQLQFLSADLSREADTLTTRGLLSFRALTHHL